MLTLIKNKVRSILGREYVISKRVALDRVEALIDRLKPVESGLGLVRVGGPSDGGYLIPDDLEGIKFCISPGVADEVNFDLEVAELGIPVVMADASVNGPPKNHDNFTFLKKHIGVSTTDTTITIEDCVSMARSGDGDGLLQLDIEGYEVPAILQTPPDVLNLFRIMVIEFHNMHTLFDAAVFPVIEAMFSKLLLGHSVVHIHPNNVQPPVVIGGLGIPPVMELTFLRNDRFIAPSHSAGGKPQQYPHPLDVDNVASLPSVDLPQAWRP